MTLIKDPAVSRDSSNLDSVVALKLIMDINTAYLVIVVNEKPRKHQLLN